MGFPYKTKYSYTAILSISGVISEARYLIGLIYSRSVFFSRIVAWCVRENNFAFTELRFRHVKLFIIDLKVRIQILVLWLVV